MQSAKDTFYVMLRDRLASINPGRTIDLRGVVRPGVLVEENELATSFREPDVFWLRWVDVSVEADGAAPLVRLRCEVHYATDGLTGNGGMDRGRLLARMDAELVTAVRRDPQNTAQTNYSKGNAETMSTNIFWADPVLGKATAAGERLSRVVTIDVFGLQKAGGL